MTAKCLRCGAPTARVLRGSIGICKRCEDAPAKLMAALVVAQGLIFAVVEALQ